MPCDSCTHGGLARLTARPPHGSPASRRIRPDLTALPAVLTCAVLALVLTLAAMRPARALYPGSYGVVYSGGQTTYTTSSGPPASYNYSSSTNNSATGAWGGGGGDYATNGNSASVSCGGTITATFTWSGTGPAPPAGSVVVKETANVSYGGTGSSGGSDIPNGTYPKNPPPTYTATRYSVKGGSSFSVNCTPYASWSGTSSGPGNSVGGSAYVGYTATAYPVTINPVGATQDSSGNWDILIGQHCAPTLSGIPSGCSVSNYQWSVTGTTFQSWTVSADQSYTTEVDGPGPLNGPNPSANPPVPAPGWYWNDLTNTTETIACTVTLTPPPGQGSPFTVTATQAVNVMVPYVSAVGTGGYMLIAYINGPNIYLKAGPTGKLPGGMYWEAVFSTPQTPVAFGYGKMEMVQIVIPNESYVNYSTRVNDPDPENNRVGLDSGYPYGVTHQNPNGGVVVTEPAEWTNQDSPNLIVQNNTTPIAYSVQMMHSFQDTLMYEPPGSSQWVPVAAFDWSTNGSATIPGTDNWANYMAPPGKSPAGWAGTVTPGSGTDFTPTNFFPKWGVIDVFPTF